MSQETACPLCFGPLDVLDVAPCWDCGWATEELDHFAQGKHSYHELEVFPGHSAVLCNFCMLDFGSYDPSFFGLPAGTVIGFDKMNLIRDLHDVVLEKDKFCPQCKGRLKFLRLVRAVRDEAASA